MFLERQIEAPVPFKKVKVKAAAASISRRLTVETPTYRDSQPLTGEHIMNRLTSGNPRFYPGCNWEPVHALLGILEPAQEFGCARDPDPVPKGNAHVRWVGTSFIYFLACRLRR
jgi:hypothetical protein